MRTGIMDLATLILILAIAACAPQRLQAIPKVENTSTIAVLSTDTPTFTLEPTFTPTETPVPSSIPTLAQATIPPILASIPGIAGTLTAVYSTPGAQETLVANQTMVSSTEAVSLNELSGSLLSQCPNPSDPPLETWGNVPVMPQATAGQEVQTLIGTYYCFRAPVTVQDMEIFYKQNLPSPQWVLQSDVNGSMVFIGLGQAGAQFLSLASGPGNKNDLIVAINLTRPLALPTPKQ
jgi:hypothetical protein